MVGISPLRSGHCHWKRFSLGNRPAHRVAVGHDSHDKRSRPQTSSATDLACHIWPTAATLEGGVGPPTGCATPIGLVSALVSTVNHTGLDSRHSPYLFYIWCWGPELNWRPTDFQVAMDCSWAFAIVLAESVGDSVTASSVADGRHRSPLLLSELLSNLSLEPSASFPWPARGRPACCGRIRQG
jgi:hypothetical protein